MADLKSIEIKDYDGRVNNGGAREGAGKKPFVDKLTKEEQTDLKEIAKAEFWAKACRDFAAPFVFSLVQDVNASNSDRLKAAQEIINRTLGKPKEKHEHSGPEGEAIAFNNSSPEVEALRKEYEDKLRKSLIK